MNYNCLGVQVPDDVAERAKEHGCVGGALYVYKDGQYGGSPPRASIGCTQATPFRRRWWEKFKVELYAGWVAFRSPSGTSRQPGSKPSRVTGKGGCKPCLICGEDRFTERAHFPTPDRHGGVETVSLCPTHHRLLDNGRNNFAQSASAIHPDRARNSRAPSIRSHSAPPRPGGCRTRCDTHRRRVAA